MPAAFCVLKIAFRFKGDSTMRSNIATLKEHFEQLFPGKWLTKGLNKKNLQTGLEDIDSSPSKGLARKRITEWGGTASSGKTTVLRSVVANWCASGLHVIYIDSNNKLVPSDWAFIEEGKAGGRPSGKKPLALVEPARLPGRFWVVRNLSNNNKKHKQNAVWAAEQLIRSNLFDVVVFDSSNATPLSSRLYTRLQRALDASKAALLVVKDHEITSSAQSNWGVYTQLHFEWSTPLVCEDGLNGVTSIAPNIHGTIAKDGQTNNIEVAMDSYAANRLFTHPQIPDRRIPKSRVAFKK
jgi:hypothetical protein